MFTRLPLQGCKKDINSSTKCVKGSFACKNNEDCIQADWLCDGDRDCVDGSDESHEVCGQATACSEDQFRCGNGECILASLHCSGGVDCPDGLDEMDCLKGLPEAGGKKAECGVDNGGCDQLCVQAAGGVVCDCRAGYTLVDNKTCEDIDECQQLGACDHNCHNFGGHHTCSCLPGYRTDPARPSSCRIEEGRVMLLFTHRSEVRITDTAGQDTRTVVENTGLATVIDFHYQAKQIFWVDSSQKRVYRSGTIDTETDKREIPRTVIVKERVGKIGDIAVDWVNSNLYWVDSQRQAISVTDHRGERTAELVTDLQLPRSLAVHPKAGWMFWSDCGDRPRIERAGMDGSHRREMVTHNVLWPNSITLDLVLDRLYWVDVKLHLIGSVGLDGSRPTVISESNGALSHPFSISVLEDWVYWTNGLNTSTLYKANKFDGSLLTMVSEAPVQPVSIAVWHAYRQPASPSLCASRPINCSHICVPRPILPNKAGVSPPKETSWTTCLCGKDHLLAEDGATCLPHLSTEGSSSRVRQHWRAGELEKLPIEDKGLEKVTEEVKEPTYQEPKHNLEDKVERLKLKEQHKNLFKGLVISISGLVLLVS